MASLTITETATSLGIEEKVVNLALGEFIPFSGSIYDIKEVTVSNLADLDTLVYNSSTQKWENKQVSGGNIDGGYSTTIYGAEDISIECGGAS